MCIQIYTSHASYIQSIWLPLMAENHKLFLFFLASCTTMQKSLLLDSHIQLLHVVCGLHRVDMLMPSVMLCSLTGSAQILASLLGRHVACFAAE